MLFSASSARSARYSWTKPSTAQNRMMTQDDDGIHVLADERGEHRRDEQDDDEDILELIEEQHPGRGFLLLRELVRAVLGEPAGDFLRRETSDGLDLQLLYRGTYVKRMPG